MTKTIHQSKDNIIEVIVTTDDHRFPRHNYKTTILRMKPTPHTRCRREGDAVTLMPKFSDIEGLLRAIQACDPSFRYSMSKKNDKPQSREQHFRAMNRRRVKRNGGGSR